MDKKHRHPGAKLVAPLDPSRRRALMRLGAAGIATAALAAGRVRDAEADTVRLTEDDAQAKALAYVHDATTVDGARYPQRSSADMVCSSCQLFKGEAGSAWGKCTLFPGKQVNADGWCIAYAARQG
jgi:hypothetical protein